MEDKLLFGLPIEYKSLIIYPLTVNEVINFGIKDYNQILSIMSLDEKEIEDTYSIFDVNAYELILVMFYSDNDLKDKILKLFKLIFRQEVYFNSNNYFITENSQKITESEYFDILNILLAQNMMTKKEYQIKSKKVKEYMELVKKAKEKYKKHFDNDNENFLLDIISTVCARHPSLNFFNIGELTLYQLYNQFHRLSYIDEYFTNIKLKLAGAENVSLDHYSRKISN